MGLELTIHGWYQQRGLILYSHREAAECHALRCHSVFESEQLSDDCVCYWGRRWIQKVLVLWAHIFLPYIWIIAIFNKRVKFFVTYVLLKILVIKAGYWSDTPHMNYTANEITRFNHQLEILKLHGE